MRRWQGTLHRPLPRRGPKWTKTIPVVYLRYETQVAHVHTYPVGPTHRPPKGTMAVLDLDYYLEWLELGHRVSLALTTANVPTVTWTGEHPETDDRNTSRKLKGRKAKPKPLQLSLL